MSRRKETNTEKRGWRWTERWSWIAGIVVALITVGGLVWSLKGGHIVKQSTPKNQQQGTTNITSFNQSGGITAQTVNVGPGKRTLNESVQEQLDNAMIGKKKVTVVAVMGDGEAFQFATEIFDYLKGKNVPLYGGGVVQAAFGRPIIGQIANQLPNDELQIIVGSRQ
jgi:hypothetical protein